MTTKIGLHNLGIFKYHKGYHKQIKSNKCYNMYAPSPVDLTFILLPKNLKAPQKSHIKITSFTISSIFTLTRLQIIPSRGGGLALSPIYGLPTLFFQNLQCNG